MAYVLLVLVVAALAGGAGWLYRAQRAKDTPDPYQAQANQAQGFEIIHRTDRPPPTSPRPEPARWSGPAGRADFVITERGTNPKARCLLTGMEVGSCTCPKHKRK
jgi:hypothetical protein